MQLYTHIMSLSKLDGIVWQIAFLALHGNPMLGLQLKHDPIKEKALYQALEKDRLARNLTLKPRNKDDIHLGCGFAGKLSTPMSQRNRT